MSFSQSLSLGDNTLFQLDVCEGKIHCNSKNVNSNTSTKSRSPNIPKAGAVSSSPGAANSNKGLDIIEESPTEKTNVLGRSIRERLKNASTSKKSERKYMRRSRSDPITTNSSKRSSSTSLYDKHGLTEDIDILFDDSEFELDETEHRTNKKSKIKLDEKFEPDDFDKYFRDILTPKIPTDIQKDDTKNNSLIALSDSTGSEGVNISEVERLMRTENFEKTTDSVALKADDEPKDDIEWDDSAYFNDLLASQQNPADEPKKNDDSLADVIIDTECISMRLRSDQNEVVEDELESCFLEVSIHLSNLNATEIKSSQKPSTSLDTSIFSRNISQPIKSNDVPRRIDESYKTTLQVVNSRNIDSLKEWSCTQPIIKTYKKKGIQEMFEWQAECLSNPKVS